MSGESIDVEVRTKFCKGIAAFNPQLESAGGYERNTAVAKVTPAPLDSLS
jgi:hypothetical protein